MRAITLVLIGIIVTGCRTPDVPKDSKPTSTTTTTKAPTTTSSTTTTTLPPAPTPSAYPPEATTTITGCNNSGASDVTTCINNFIANNPGPAFYLPAGTYK